MSFAGPTLQTVRNPTQYRLFLETNSTAFNTRLGRPAP
jgi:hypothetical protein